MTDVKCLVEECKYNDSYYCIARDIEVRSSGDPIDISKADDTACETFTKRS